MLRLTSHFAAVLRDLKRKGFVLFLDFDGTLAPIVLAPSKAEMSTRTRTLVTRLAKYVPVYIVSGRALKDIKGRVGIPGVALAGNHGMEWTEADEYKHKTISNATRNDLKDAHKALEPLARERGVLIEEKGYSFAFHYRMLSAHTRPRVLRSANRALLPILARGRIEALEQKRLLDVRPKGWNKGDFAQAVMKKFPLEIAIYIGDDTTDEDAFKVLKKGVTICVGNNLSSAARYYVDSRNDVDRFLALLLARFLQ